MSVQEDDDLRLVRNVLQAQEYWRLKGLRADVVILNEHPVDYLDQMHEALSSLIAGGSWGAWRDRPGGVFLRRTDGLAGSPIASCSSRPPVRCSRAPAANCPSNSIARRPPAAPGTPFVPRVAPLPDDVPLVLEPPPLLMANGLGGFTEDGREYVISMGHDTDAPAPWSNILANPEFGSLVTSSGASFTWSVNSREHRLTPFDNDPVVEGTAEAIFVRDDDTGETWGATPSPLPRRQGDAWQVRHGAGITSFDRVTRRLRQRLEVFVFPDAPVKASVLTITNASTRPRRLSLFGYNAWLLGPPRAGIDAVRGHQSRCPHRSDRRAQSLDRGVRLARGVCLVQRARPFHDGRSHRLRGAERVAVGPGRADDGHAVQPARRRPRSVRGSAREPAPRAR